MRLIIITGTTISFVIYLLWLVATLGVIPLTGDQSFTTVKANNGSVDKLISVITSLIKNRWLSAAIHGFSNIAMTTSFLGVTLGLFDFLADYFKRPNSLCGRAQTALLTFIPPLIFVFYYPNGFKPAIRYAAIFTSILAIILPALMAYMLRTDKTLTSIYKVAVGNTLLISIMIAGLLVTGIQLRNIFPYILLSLEQLFLSLSNFCG